MASMIILRLIFKNLTRNLAQDTSIQGLVYPAAIGIDSADCAKNGTLISLIKSVELTRLVLSTNFSAYPPASVIDSFILSAIDSTEQNTQLLASYSGSNDSVSLTNADFVSYLKNNLLKLRFRFHNVPQGFSYTGNYTLVITARPIQ